MQVKGTCIVCYKNSTKYLECCNQYLCDYCLNRWLKINNSCPHCRNENVISKSNYLKFNFKEFNNNKYILIKIISADSVVIPELIKVIGSNNFNLNINKQILLKKLRPGYSLKFKFDNLKTLFTLSNKKNLYYYEHYSIIMNSI